MSKSVDMLFSNSSDLIEPAKAGTVRRCGSTPKRMPQLPDVPAVAEIYPGYDYSPGMVTPCRAACRRRFRSASRVLLPITREPQIVETFNKLASTRSAHAGEALATIRKDMPVYSQIVDIAGVRLK